MSQIQRKWLADGIINSAKIDPNSPMVFNSASLTGHLGIGTTADTNSDIFIVDSTNAASVSMQYTGGLGPYEIYQVNTDSAHNFNILDITQGKNRLAINTTGLIGVGTTNPQANIHVQSTSSNVTVDLDNEVTPHGVNFQLNSDTNGHFNIANVTSPATFMTVDQTGSVGIGTTYPQDSLHVRVASNPADLRLDSAGGSGRAYVLRSHTDGGFYLIDNNNSATRFWVGSSGNFNVAGDTTMMGGLKVNGTTTIVNTEVVSGSQLLVTQGSDASAVGIYQPLTGALSPVEYISNSGQGPALSINSAPVGGNPGTSLTMNGYIGIGTVSPGSPIEIIDATNPSINVMSSDASTLPSAIFLNFDDSKFLSVGLDNVTGLQTSLPYAGIITAAVNNALVLQAGSGSGPALNRMVILPSGFIGIGTTVPSCALDVIGQIRASSGIHANTAGVFIDYSGVNKGQLSTDGSILNLSTASTIPMVLTAYAANMSFKIGGTTAMTITTPSGYVGIGSTSPNNPLDVVGNVYVSNGVGIGTTVPGANALTVSNSTTGGTAVVGITGSFPSGTGTITLSGSTVGMTTTTLTNQNLSIGSVSGIPAINMTGIGTGLAASWGASFGYANSSASVLGVNGSIGIGTTVPGTPLEIDDAVNPTITVRSLDATVYPAVALWNFDNSVVLELGMDNAAGNETGLSYATFLSSTNKAIVFQTGTGPSLTTMTIRETGFIGIGTTAAATAGDNMSIFSSTGNAQVTLTSSSLGSGGILILGGSTPAIGIGTTTPNYPLEIVDTWAGGASAHIVGPVGIGTTANPLYSLNINTYAVGHYALNVTGTTYLSSTLSVLGNVGIGTTNTGGYSLNNTGNTTLGGTLNVTGNTTISGGVAIGAIPPGSAGTLNVYGAVGIGSTSNNSDLTVYGNAHIGNKISTTHAPKTVSGTVTWTSGTDFSGSLIYISTAASTPNVILAGGVTDDMLAIVLAAGQTATTVTSSGNAVIGTIQPGRTGIWYCIGSGSWFPILLS